MAVAWHVQARGTPMSNDVSDIPGVRRRKSWAMTVPRMANAREVLM